MTVLVTGFEPFGEHEVNPSQVLAEALGGVVLPVSYARTAAALRAAIDEREPDVVVCFGLAQKRTAITPERFAHNLDEAGTTDNEASPGTGKEIDPAGPLAYRSTLPVDEIVAALTAEDIPAQVSRDAGGFLCNHVFYVLMQTLSSNQVGGFVHVPPFDAIAQDDLIRAGRVIVATCERHISKS